MKIYRASVWTTAYGHYEQFFSSEPTPQHVIGKLRKDNPSDEAQNFVSVISEQIHKKLRVEEVEVVELPC